MITDHFIVPIIIYFFIVPKTHSQIGKEYIIYIRPLLQNGDTH